MRNDGAGPERHVLRGEVYLSDLWTAGGRLQKRRPVLVVQNDTGNLHSSETIVAGIRDVGGRPPLAILVPVSRGTGGLEKDSSVDAGHVLTILRRELGRRIGRMPPEVMARVDHALRISLGLA
jgi:mRNA interferase MazF